MSGRPKSSAEEKSFKSTSASAKAPSNGVGHEIVSGTRNASHGARDGPEEHPPDRTGLKSKRSQSLKRREGARKRPYPAFFIDTTQ